MQLKELEQQMGIKIRWWQRVLFQIELRWKLFKSRFGITEHDDEL